MPLKQDVFVPSLDFVVDSTIQANQNEKWQIEVDDGRGHFEDFRVRIFRVTFIRLAKRNRSENAETRKTADLD